MSGPCSSCSHWSVIKVPPNLRAGGWGRCELIVAWQYQSGSAACSFDPPKYVARQAIPAPQDRVQPTPCDLPEEIDFG